MCEAVQNPELSRWDCVIPWPQQVKYGSRTWRESIAWQELSPWCEGCGQHLTQYPDFTVSSFWSLAMWQPEGWGESTDEAHTGRPPGWEQAEQEAEWRWTDSEKTPSTSPIHRKSHPWPLFRVHTLGNKGKNSRRPSLGEHPKTCHLRVTVSEPQFPPPSSVL